MPYDCQAKQTAYTRQWRIENREQHLANRRAYKKKVASTEAGKLQRRKEALKHYYGMTLEEYQILLENQGGCCAVCHSSDPGHNHKNFCVDHNHQTGEIRGLLCHYCNRGLGFLGDGDDIQRVESLLNYLRSGDK